MVQRILESKEPMFFAFTADGCVMVITILNNVKRNILLDSDKSKEFITSIHQY
jgi:hypothetical protein